VARSRRASFDWKAYLPVLPFFEGFDPDEMDEFAAAGKVLELPRGAWIFAAGLEAQACYVVLRGAVEIFTRNDSSERRVAIAGPGELVGFVALLRAPRTAATPARAKPAGSSKSRARPSSKSTTAPQAPPSACTTPSTAA